MIFSISIIFSLIYLTKCNSFCENICSNVNSTVTCNDPTTCGQKKGLPGDYDFFVFSQLYTPQFCEALQNNFDPTSFHPPNTHCLSPSTVKKTFMIHGLWPNYVNGYPHCCEKAAAVPLTTGNNATFNPELFPSKIYKEMQQHWSDPTTTQQNCELWNHEWLKHGTCVSNSILPELFFNTTLNVFRRHSLVNRKILALFGGHNNLERSLIERLFPTRIQLMCDGTSVVRQNNARALLELRTCWDHTSLKIVDCPVLQSRHDALNCPQHIYLSQ